MINIHAKLQIENCSSFISTNTAMILQQEDIDLYLRDKHTRKFYIEYSKDNPDVEKLLEMSINLKVKLYEPLKLDHYLLVDISLNCNQRFEIVNDDQFERYMILIDYYNLLYDKSLLKDIDVYNIYNRNRYREAIFIFVAPNFCFILREQA